MQAKSALDDLAEGIRSSLPEVWAPAARKLGALATGDADALRKLTALLRSKDQSRKGFAGLASYLCHGGDSPDLLARHERKIASKLKLLTEIDVAVNMPDDWNARIPWVAEEWEQDLTKTRRELEKQQGLGNARAVQAKERIIHQLEEHLAGGSSTSAALLDPGNFKAWTDGGWDEFGTYLLGLSREGSDSGLARALLNLTLDEMVLALCALVRKYPSGPSGVGESKARRSFGKHVADAWMKVPRLLLNMNEPADGPICTAVGRTHIDDLQGDDGFNYGFGHALAPANQYNWFCVALHQCLTTVPFGVLWAAGLPGATGDVVQHVNDLFEGTEAEAGIASHRLLSGWAENMPKRDADFWLKEREMQARLMAFIMVVNPPEDSTTYPWERSPEYRFRQPYRRLSLVVANLKHSATTESTVRAPLIQALNRLCEYDWKESSGTKHQESCVLRQAVFLAPFLQTTTHRVTSDKYLSRATARALDNAFELDGQRLKRLRVRLEILEKKVSKGQSLSNKELKQRDEAEEELARGHSLFFQVSYTIFSSLPSRRFVDKVVQYSIHSGVTEVMKAAANMLGRVIEIWDDKLIEASELNDLEADYEAFLSAYESATGMSPGSFKKPMHETVDVLRRSGSIDPHTTRDRMRKDLLRIGVIAKELNERILIDDTTPIPRYYELSDFKEGDQDESLWKVDILRKIAEQEGAFEDLVNEIAVIEKDVLIELGSPLPNAQTLVRWAELLGRLKRVSIHAQDTLPCLERELIRASIAERTDQYQARIEKLSDMIEAEIEDRAVELFKERDNPDRLLAVQWMKSRYMLVELAESTQLKSIGLLCKFPVVMAWIFLPFIVSAICAQWYPNDHWAVFSPFLVALGLGVVASFAVFTEMRHYKKKTGDAFGPRSSLSDLVLPQITGALLIGVFELIGGDEPWYTAIADYAWLRVVTIFMLISVVYFFIRSSFLSGQTDLDGRKARRTLSIMAMGLWQSFTLTLYFGLAYGWVMFQRMGGEAALKGSSDVSGMPFNIAGIDYYEPKGFLYNAIVIDLACLGDTEFVLFPWTLLSWTFQLFFFSAILQRIMNRNDS